MTARRIGALIAAAAALIAMLCGAAGSCGSSNTPAVDKFNRDCERKGGVPTVKDHVRRCAPGPMPTPGPRWQ